ncbi:MAG: hypothetical protein ACOX77_09460 [Caldicoprobacterales bacterium]|jgi:V/A-type H+-transporting ATPase subunit G/H
MSSMEVINRIKEAEARAEKIRKEAQEEARKILNRAQDEAEDLARNLRRETIERGNRLMAETESQVKKEIEALGEENKALISKLRTDAEANLDEAISFVVGRIVKDYGRN